MANRIEIDKTVKNKVSLNIVGDDNVVIIKKSGPISGKISISLTGNNCSLVLEEGIWVSTFLTIIMGQIHPNFGMIENAHIHIGKNTSFESTSITTFNSNSSVEIGERCMFSFGINVYNTDGHPIMDAANGKIINKVKRLKIGNHVWVGFNATILKNTFIPDDCIIGWGSVVNSRYTPPPHKNCIIAGNPAKVVKTGVTWDSNGSMGYVQNGGVTAQISGKVENIIASEKFVAPKQFSNRILYKIWKHLNKRTAEFFPQPRTFYNKIRHKIWKHLSKKQAKN